MTARRSSETPTSVALWIAAGLAVPVDVDRRLRAGGVALELGCGGGLGCLALAEAYPEARVVGHDRDAEAIARARSLAETAGLAGRVSFLVTDSERLPRAAYDLATLQTLSARSDAQQILNAVRNALVPDGVCLAVEPADALVPGRGRSRDNLDALRAAAEHAGFSRFTLLGRAAVDIYELRR
jgi:predicted O-methyltransferase YrrM